MHDGNPREHIGANNPPPFDQSVLDALDARVNEFILAGGDWRDLGEIQTEEQAGDLNDYLSGLKKNRDEVEKARKAAKKPHDDASKAVQAAFTPLVTKIDFTIGKLRPMLTAFMDRKEAERRAAERAAREEAARAAKAAEEAAAKAAARNDIAGEVAAQEQAKAAAEKAKEAERLAKGRVSVASGSGGGRTASYRTYWRAEVANPRVAYMELSSGRHPEIAAELAETIRALGERVARSKDFNPETDTLPGFVFHAERRAV